MEMPIIKNRMQFESFMEEIDLFLQAERVPIHAREIRALSEASKRLDMKLPMAPINTGPIQGLYHGASLSAHIIEWYNQRYGDRLKIDFSIGYSVLLIRGDPWLIRFPTIYGRVTAVCEPDLNKKLPDFVSNRAGEPEQKAYLNVLKCIDNLPIGLAKDLSRDELVSILKYYLFGHDLFNLLNSYYSKENLAIAALSDLKSSAKYCISNSSEYGLSRWSSLQAAEKLIKMYIQQNGQQFPYTHELSKLLKIAYNLNLPQIDEGIISSIQCPASVRYDSHSADINEVIVAHQNTMSVGSIIIKFMVEQKKR